LFSRSSKNDRIFINYAPLYFVLLAPSYESPISLWPDRLVNPCLRWLSLKWLKLIQVPPDPPEHPPTSKPCCSPSLSQQSSCLVGLFSNTSISAPPLFKDTSKSESNSAFRTFISSSRWPG